MPAPIFLVAKHVPNLQRHEPRNIGVILWSMEGLVARFWAEKPDDLGNVDGRKIPGWVSSKEAYGEWIRYWRGQVSRDEIQITGRGNGAPKNSPECIPALMSGNKHSFFLSKGGVLLDRIAKKDLPLIIDDLYEDLVDSASIEAKDPTVEAKVDAILKDPEYHFAAKLCRNYTIHCPITDDRTVIEEMQFTFGLGNGSPIRLYQSVPIKRRDKSLRDIVDATAWKFDKVRMAGQIQREQGAALICASRDDLRQDSVNRAIRILESVTRVINTHGGDELIDELQGIPSINGTSRA